MITISDCPITGLKRKLDYQFHWLKNASEIKIKCWVSHYLADGTTLVENARIKTYVRELIASDSHVNPANGEIMTEQEYSAYLEQKTAREAYLEAKEAYDLAVIAHVSAMNAYSVASAQYTADLAAYETAQSQYTTDYEEWVSNGTVGTPPVPPIAPTEPTAPIEPVEPTPVSAPAFTPITEYTFYAHVLGVTPIILPDLLESIILLRDSQGKFNI